MLKTIYDHCPNGKTHHGLPRALPFGSQAVKKTAAKAQPKVPPTRRVTWKIVNLIGTHLKAPKSMDKYSLTVLCCVDFVDLLPAKMDI